MIEIKANMGWCRNANGVIDDIVVNNQKFQQEGQLVCEFSNGQSQIVTYGQRVHLFLIALTENNCQQKWHINNKNYAQNRGVFQYNLFSGWYGSLQNLEIDQFAQVLLSM